jgi:hypothetical protein
MSRAEKGFMATYDGKPVMTRPQHRFFRGPGYLEIDIDAHLYAYIARKGVHTYRHHLDKMIFDSGFVLQGGVGEELPEQILAATRVHRLDFAKARPAPWAAGAGAGGAGVAVTPLVGSPRPSEGGGEAPAGAGAGAGASEE